MSDENLDNLSIRKNETNRGTECLIVDLGGARAHIRLSSDRARVTVNDSENQASIILDREQDVVNVTHPKGVTAIKRTTGIMDPMAITSSDSV